MGRFKRVLAALKTGWQRVPGSPLVTIAVIFAWAYRGLSCAEEAYDTDMWFLLATGREICAAGIPYTNPFALFDGLRIVVQQWVPCMLEYRVFAEWGFAGVQVAVAVQYLLVSVLVLLLCMKCRQGRPLTVEAVSGVTFFSVLLCSPYISARPTSISMCVCLAFLLLLEAYSRCGQWRFLAPLPLLVVVHVNVQAAILPLDFLLVSLYALPDLTCAVHVFAPGAQLKSAQPSYGRPPLVVMLALCACAALLNPYGVDGALYVFESYGAAAYGGMIQEMDALRVTGAIGWLYLTVVLLGCYAMGRLHRRGCNAVHVLLFLIGVVAAGHHLRNIWALGVLAVPLLSSAYGGVSLLPVNNGDRRIVQSPLLCLLFAACVVIACAVRFCSIPWSVMEDEDSKYVPQIACAYLDDYCASHGLDKGDVRLCTEFHNGGFFEWNGYKVSMDARPELWENGISGVDEHYYQEYVDSTCWTQNTTHPFWEDTCAYVEKYGFDIVVAADNSRLEGALEHMDAYEKVRVGNEYSVWQLDERS